MGRKHRRAPSDPAGDVTRLAHGGARTETRRGVEWVVRDIPAHRAEKAYRCPVCSNEVPPGQAHIVAWHAEHFFGDEAAMRDRRHYHAHCWRLA
ncbi:ATP/GTP-binding protein [Leucobacter rhizosphaerae]|uniref:ATP/GTP-binding protein n=1 Tax=Leucobacter rhizosphaerae TaxID=2932245 RepID=A0ABY4FWI3_9MICO|nr:ATP/GTP-binding protein [Leucobacter rhizosphaerae]UOQ60671.1 ATP/GTP-binding protein [Leucobacter rhizosphaerae]